MAQLSTTMQQRDRVCVVIGMHRSGTSLTTQILQQLGVRLGERLLPPNPYNEKGPFEQQEIIEAQKQINRILNRRVMSPGGLLPYPERWWESEAVAEPLAILKMIVARELKEGSANGAVWGFKDPHTIRILPYWRHLFEELHVDPVYLLAVRHPTAVAQSIHTRDRVPVEQAEFLWLLHYVDAFRYCGDSLAAVVVYDDWFNSPLEQAKRLSDALGFGGKLDDAALERCVNEVIAPDLRHNLSNDAPPVLPACLSLYDLIRRHAVKGDALAEIAAFVEDFDAYEKTFSPWAKLLEKENIRAADMERQRRELATRAVPHGYGRVVRRTAGIVPKLVDAVEPSFGVTSQHSHPLAVAILAPHLFSPHSPHGLQVWAIATARNLCDFGCRVTVAALPPGDEDPTAYERLLREIDRSTVSLEYIPNCEIKTALGMVGQFLDEPRRVYDWLKNRSFDVVHAPLLGGDVYFCLLAKLLGVALTNTRLLISANGTTLSEAEGDNRLFNEYHQIAKSFMERQCLELADGVLFPTETAYKWCLSKGYQPRTDRCFITGGPVYRVTEAGEEQQQAQTGVPEQPAKTDLLELVFVGDLTIRSGLVVFCEAVELLQRKYAKRIKVTIFGRRVPEFAFDKYFNEKLKHWPLAPDLKENWTDDFVLRYLQRHQPLVVCPQRSPIPVFPVNECLNAGVQVLLSSDLDLADAFSESDWGYLRFRAHPKFLASKIEKTLLGVRKERTLAFDLGPQLAAFEGLHTPANLERLFPTSHEHEDSPNQTRQPLVSVCITHFNRPQLLRQALESLKIQTYREFEVVIIDDGSDDAEARRDLASIENEIAERGWRVIWGTNRYPGAARNHAVREARGEYILLMDDDNVAKEDEIRSFVNAALSSDADLLTCFRENFKGNEYPQEDSGICCIPTLGNALSLGVFTNVFGDTNCLIKRTAFERIGGFTEDYGVGKEDYELFMRACVAGLRFFVVPEMLYWYRESGDRIRHKHQDNVAHARQQAGDLRVLRPVLESIPANLFDLIYLSGSLEPARPPKKKRLRTRVWRKVSKFFAKE